METRFVGLIITFHLAQFEEITFTFHSKHCKQYILLNCNWNFPICTYLVFSNYFFRVLSVYNVANLSIIRIYPTQEIQDQYKISQYYK